MAFGMTGWGFILGAAGLITLIAAWTQLAKSLSFLKGSESVTGSVAGKFVHCSKNNNHYSMDVEYTVDGTKYKRSVPATPAEYNNLAEGSPFELKYKPDNPKKVIRPDNLTEKSIKTMRIIALAAAALTLAGVILFIAGSM